MDWLRWAGQRLKDLGWLAADFDLTLADEIIEKVIHAALRDYQLQFGLAHHGQLDGPTQRHLALPRFCGHPDVMALTAEQQRGRDPRVRWHLAGTLAAIGEEALRQAVQMAFDLWTAVADVAGLEAPDPGSADFLIATGGIDGPLGVLAWCELPGPPVQHARIDNAERYILQRGPHVQAGYLDLGRILAHEWGHLYGLDHSRSGLMAPTYSEAIDGPQAIDAERMVAVYGRPRVTPPVPPPPPVPTPVPGQTKITVEIYNAERILIPGFRLTPIV